MLIAFSAYDSIKVSVMKFLHFVEGHLQKNEMR